MTTNHTQYGYQDSTETALQSLAEQCAGRSGSKEAETSILDSKADDYITVVSTRGAHIGAILKRCGSAVLRHKVLTADGDDVVFLHVARSAWRGAHMGFKNIDSKGPAMTAEQKAKAWGTR